MMVCQDFALWMDDQASGQAARMRSWGAIDAVATIDLFEERRRRRRAGDPRLTDPDREILRRIATGELAFEFQAALDAALEDDPLLRGQDSDEI